MPWEAQDVDGIIVARFTHPPANYYTEGEIGELAVLVRGWSSSRARAVVLTGGVSGGFITHSDPHEFRATLDEPERAAEQGALRNSAALRVLEDLTRLPMPVIAALSGDAMGFGFELALACDIRIGQRGDFRYGLPEVRLGGISGAGGTQRLARLIGLGPALNLVLRAKILRPEDALAAGLVTELHDDALGASLQIAAEIAALPATAVTQAKRVLHLGVDGSLAAGSSIETEASLMPKLSPDSRAALDTYLDLPLAARRHWLEVARPRAAAMRDD